MKTIIKISAWVLIVFGLIFLLVSTILTVAGILGFGNPAGLARILLPSIPVLLSNQIQRLLLVGMGEVVYLLLLINENTSPLPISKVNQK